MLILSFVPIFLGLGFLYIVLGAWLVTVGFTAVQAGLLISAQGIAVVLTSIPLGIISDIYGRKKLLILGNLAGAAALLVFALTTNFSYLISASVVLGFAEGASVTTWNALLADLTDNSNRNRVFSRSFIMINVTTGIGLVLPGAFPALQSLTGLTNYTLHRETLLILGLARFIIPLVGAWFYYRFNVSDSYSGPILAFSNILIGFSAYASPRLATKFGQMRAIILVTGSSMLFMLSMAFIPIFALAAGSYIVRAALMNMAGPLIDSFSMSIFPAEQRGLVSALSNITFRLPNSLSTYFGGFILGLGLLQLPFFIASTFYIIGLTAFYIFFVATKRYAAQIASLS